MTIVVARDVKQQINQRSDLDLNYWYSDHDGIPDFFFENVNFEEKKTTDNKKACMCFLCHLLIFFSKINFFIFFQENYQSVNCRPLDKSV